MGISHISAATRKARIALIGAIVTIVCSVVLYVFVIQGLRNPVSGDSREYTAEFADVSGLTANADVRDRGVRVGKVTDIAVVNNPSGVASARIRISVRNDIVITSGSKLAVKFQSLAGLRYIDLSMTGRAPEKPVKTIALSNTIPSFDITRVFNGLEPVLREVSPDDVNMLARMFLDFIQGDGRNADQLFDGITRLSMYATSRAQVIETIIDNLGSVSGPLSGKSAGLANLLRDWDGALTRLQPALAEYPVVARYAPEVLGGVNRLLNSIGLVPGLSVDQLLDRTFRTSDVLGKTLKAIPPLLSGLTGIRSSEASGPCTHGQAALTNPVSILLNGQVVKICRAN